MSSALRPKIALVHCPKALASCSMWQHGIFERGLGVSSGQDVAKASAVQLIYGNT